MRRSYKEIKILAKRKIEGHFGDAVMITFIPTILVFAIFLFFTMTTDVLPFGTAIVANQIFMMVIGTFATYMTTRLLLKFVKGMNRITFDHLFDYEKGVFQVILYLIIIELLSFACFIPIIPYFIDFYRNITIIADAVAVQNYIQSTNFLIKFNQAMKLTYLFMFFYILIMIKFKYTIYLMIERKLRLFEALQTSWKLTNGNFFRILFFPISFLILGIFTIITFFLGGIYVIPYFKVSEIYMYYSILEEKGYDVGDCLVSTSSIDVLE